MASGPITLWQIDGETMETVKDFIFLGSKIFAVGDQLLLKRFFFFLPDLKMEISLLEISIFVIVQLRPHAWTAAHQASLSITSFQNLLKFMSTESVMPFKHLLCCPLLLLPSVFPSIRVFSSESAICIS